MASRADLYFERSGRWQEEIGKLRAIALSCGLNEEVKWGCPCYTSGGRNIVLIHIFKEYCALLFFKGALMKDPENILVRQTANVQAARQIRFTGVKEIKKLSPILKRYIREATELEKTGAKVPLKKTKEYTKPPEFEKKLKELPSLRSAFKALTPGRQRGYILHFSSAKLSSTREARIDKCIPRIFAGKGFNE